MPRFSGRRIGRRSEEGPTNEDPQPVALILACLQPRVQLQRQEGSEYAGQVEFEWPGRISGNGLKVVFVPLFGTLKKRIPLTRKDARRVMWNTLRGHRYIPRRLKATWSATCRQFLLLRSKLNSYPFPEKGDKFHDRLSFRN